MAAKISPPFKCIRGNKLCHRIDLRLLNLALSEYKLPISRDQCLNLTEIVIQGYEQAQEKIEQATIQFPDSAATFVSLVRDLHGHIFKGTQLSFAGSFRTEPVFFGSSPYEFEGVKPNKIQPELETLYLELPPLSKLQSIQKPEFLKH